MSSPTARRRARSRRGTYLRVQKPRIIERELNEDEARVKAAPFAKVDVTRHCGARRGGVAKGREAGRRCGQTSEGHTGVFLTKQRGKMHAPWAWVRGAKEKSFLGPSSI